jgi:hypothetical protein
LFDIEHFGRNYCLLELDVRNLVVAVVVVVVVVVQLEERLFCLKYEE